MTKEDMGLHVNQKPVEAPDWHLVSSSRKRPCEFREGPYVSKLLSTAYCFPSSFGANDGA